MAAVFGCVFVSLFAAGGAKISDGLLTADQLWLTNELASTLTEDAALNFTQLANKYGMECEQHDVITEDGYILGMFNIPGDRKRPVVLFHGFIDSSDTFIVRGRNSIAAKLAAEGYDVWLGNSRGNRHSRRHVSLDPDVDEEYWDFSTHELGLYDLPASIDYVLKATGQQQLYVISHSEGGPAVLIMGCMRPEYNDKVGLFVALGATKELTDTGPYTLILRLIPLVKVFSALTGVKEIFRTGTEISLLFQFVCTQFSSSCYELLVRQILFKMAALEPVGTDEIDAEFFKTLLGHYPSGTSTKNLQHVYQRFDSKRFAQYDYGVRNKEVYGSVDPPVYDISKVVMRTAILYSHEDGFVSTEGSRKLARELPNAVDVYKLDYFAGVSHYDFVYGKNMDVYLFPHLIEVMANYTLS